MPTPDALPAFEAMQRTPGPVDLFTFSACIGVAHRIHYDQPYSTQKEGHADVVVPGPLQAAYMCQVVRRWIQEAGLDGRLASLTYRHLRPVYVDTTLEISGEVKDVDDAGGRITCAVWTHIPGQEGRTTQGEAVVALD